MSKAHVLVVDDQDSIRHFVGKAFESEGYTVRTTGSVVVAAVWRRRCARSVISKEMSPGRVREHDVPKATGNRRDRDMKVRILPGRRYRPVAERLNALGLLIPTSQPSLKR